MSSLGFPDDADDAETLSGDQPVPFPHWEAVPGGRMCPICGEIITTPGTIDQAVFDHWATHEPTSFSELVKLITDEGKRRHDGNPTMTDKEWLALIDRILQ